MGIAKDFDEWNLLKKSIDVAPMRRNLFFTEREVWWCSLGVNVGVESNGKNQRFERPILIVKKFNGEMIWIVPLTSKPRIGPHYQRLIHDAGVSWAHLSQIRTVSSKRLLRKIGMVTESDFLGVVQGIISYIK